MIAPSTEAIRDLLSDIRQDVETIQQDYLRAYDEAYGLSSRDRHEDDPTGRKATENGGLKAACMDAEISVAEVARQLEALSAELKNAVSGS